MKKILQPIHNKYSGKVREYIDDLLVAMKGDKELHQQIMNEILDLFAQELYFLQPAKCKFKQTRIEYLGLIVDGKQLTIDPKKADSLHNWPQELTMVKEVRSVLGVLGYQCPFIPHYADIAHPLMTLTKKSQPFNWTEECWKALDTLISAVTSGPILSQPDLH